MYGCVPLEEAETIIALGGDGLMLDALHVSMKTGARVYGMNFGSVGFLMNEFRPDGLAERIATAEEVRIHPLRVWGEDVNSTPFEALAINEVSLLRETRQTAKIKITIDGRDRMGELQADGVLVATPAGSTASGPWACPSLGRPGEWPRAAPAARLRRPGLGSGRRRARGRARGPPPAPRPRAAPPSARGADRIRPTAPGPRPAPSPR